MLGVSCGDQLPFCLIGNDAVFLYVTHNLSRHIEAISLALFTNNSIKILYVFVANAATK